MERTDEARPGYALADSRAELVVGDAGEAVGDLVGYAHSGLNGCMHGGGSLIHAHACVLTHLFTSRHVKSSHIDSSHVTLSQVTSSEVTAR